VSKSSVFSTSGLGPDGWKDKLSAQLMQRAAQWADLDLFSTPFSEEEAMLVLVGRFMLGNCWTDVAKFLPGR
jgi:prephenate dehydrogenase